MRLWRIIFMSFAFYGLSLSAGNLTALRCEYLSGPIGVDNARPRFSWKMEDGRTGIEQAAYSIRVSEDSLDILHGKGNMWQSGKVVSGNNRTVYAGKALKPRTRYYWSVDVYNQYGELYTPSSRFAWFETGKMGEPWNADWISDSEDTLQLSAPYFRKEFTISRPVADARIYLAAGGLADLWINGNRVDSTLLNPMFTQYDKRCLYMTYDVTRCLNEGGNAVGIVLGNGWYNFQSHAVWNFETAPWRNRPTFMLELVVRYQDGSCERIKSDTSWKTSFGPIVFNSIYTGEHYDARKELTGWSEPGYEDNGWRNAVLRDAPSRQIVSQVLSPIRITEKFTGLECRKLSDSIYVFKLPVNIAGVSKLRVQGERGTVIRLKHGESIDANGRVDQSTIAIYADERDGKDPFQTDVYILKGDGPEEFMPRFNYKGFQYVEVIADRPVLLDSGSLETYRMNSDVAPVGRIVSSEPLVNQLWEATNRSYLSNLYGYPTDCPHREKNGWTGDAHIALDAALYNYDAVSVYEKWMADHREAQRPDGLLPGIIPTAGWGYSWGNGIDWVSSAVVVPWMIYLFYDDVKILRDNYSLMKKLVDYVTRNSTGYLTDYGLGDWVPYKSVADKELIISLFYYRDALLLSKIAGVVKNPSDSISYKRLSEKIKNAINGKFLDKERGLYAAGLQSELCCPLYFGIVPEDCRQKVADNLARRVLADGKHLDVGLLGSKCLLEALSGNGYADLAYELATQRTYPSWGWWIANGATTLYETWKIETETLSRNHVMFGEVSAWFYKELGGIHADETAPGFRSFVVAPHFVKKLDYFLAEYNSAQGTVRSSWKRVGNGRIMFRLTIPPNSRADVYVRNVRHVSDETTGDGIVLSGKNDCHSLPSGSYLFVIEEKE